MPAAGQGRRLGSRQRKAFVPLADEPLILHVLRALQATPAIGWIVVVAHPEDLLRMRRLVQRQRLRRVSAVVAGGPSRARSVVRGVAALPSAAKWLVIHDGARPCVTPSLMTSVIRHAKRSGAAACGLPASVTVKAVDESGAVRLTLDREALWFVQTPQAFRRDWFQEALKRAGEECEAMPDDVSFLEWAGFPVRMVPGDPLNIKVTTREDLLLAEFILRRQADVRGAP